MSTKQASKAGSNWVAPEVTEGSVFYSSWGYDQTNVDFYKVVRRTAATVWVQKVGQVNQAEHGPHDSVVPSFEPVKGAWVQQPGGWREYDAEAAAPIAKHRLRVYGSGDYSVCFTVASYANAYLWDGKPKYQTGYGYGH